MISVDPRSLLRLGRHENEEAACRLGWSGSGVRFKVSCTFLTVEAESFGDSYGPYLGVLADGAPIARWPLMPGRHVYPVLMGMEKGVSHEITILRDSQPGGDEPLPVTLTALETDGEIAPAEVKPRLIEFIGDSLTAGEGCLGPVSAMEWRMAWISHMGTYAFRASQLLGAEERVLALGGYGAWRSWDDNADHVMGRLYDRLCAPVAAGDIPYDFGGREADAVVINLGTNDAGPMSRAEDRAKAGREFKKSAEELMCKVRQRQPGAYILWAYGLCGGAMEKNILEAVEARRAAGDERTGYLALTDCGQDLGSRGHPGRGAHERAAGEVAEALTRVWEGRL